MHLYNISAINVTGRLFRSCSRRDVWCGRSRGALQRFSSVSQHHGMIIGGSRVTSYRVRHEQQTFLLGKKWPQAPFPFSFASSLSLTPSRINRLGPQRQPGIQGEGVPRSISRSRQSRLPWCTKNSDRPQAATRSTWAFGKHIGKHDLEFMRVTGS